MSEFKKNDNVLEYVKKGLADGTFVPVKAEKYSRIIARPGVLGEKIITWSEKDGTAILEKVATVELDEETRRPGWVVTKADEDGILIVDRHKYL